MTTGYALERSPQEYERLRAQAQVWESATARLLDQAGVPAGASCLDAGCGPGETMRLIADRAGAGGRVLGIDIDTSLGAMAVAALRDAGYPRCHFQGHDLNRDEPLPQAPFDLVYARLVLLHTPQRVEVLRRLWAAVASGGLLVVQDYDMRTMSACPDLDSVDAIARVITTAFAALGGDARTGAALPQLLVAAGAGAPDRTDVAGRVESLATARPMLEQVFRSVLPAAISHGITDRDEGAAVLAALDRDATLRAGHTVVWPSLVGVWKHKRPQ
jgi:SAM-dependent methyltransferase